MRELLFIVLFIMVAIVAFVIAAIDWRLFLLIAVGVAAYYVRRAVRRYKERAQYAARIAAEEAAQAEYLAARAAYVTAFSRSDDFDLVRRYVERTEVFTGADIAKIRELLGSRWQITDQELLELTRIERVRQIHDSIRRALEGSGAQTHEEYCAAFLDICGENRTEYLGILRDVMHRAGAVSNYSLENVSQVLAWVEHQQELQRFKQNLMTPLDHASYPDLDVLDGLGFEQVVADLYRKMGYRAEVTKASGDHGADVIAEKHGVKTVIQAKCWAGSVGNTPVQEVAAAKQHYGAQRGVAITTGRFTPGARTLARSNAIELIDRDQLEELLRHYWHLPNV